LLLLEFSNLSWLWKLARMGVEMVDKGAFVRLSNLVVESGLLACIKAVQLEGPKCTKIRQLLRHKAFALRMMGCSSLSMCRRVKD
jgi:hypothetical protein